MKSRFNSLLFNAISGFALVFGASHSFGATETFNTVGTFNWVCPGGVTSIQVECWGGGGAGGAATKVTNTGTNTSQNGGGGGGGAYARRVVVPVTPGSSYTITIPAAAVSVVATDLTSNTRGQTGGTVTFVGNSGVTVTAVGGQGGVSILRDSNVTAGGAAGAGGAVAASSGDVVFAGGAGSAGNTGATNVSGSGGGGAGNAGAGGAGFTSTASPYVGAGLGGTIGGGAGGVGRTGNPATSGNTNKGVGTPGASPGGGGGGAKNQSNTSFLGGAGGLGQIVLTYPDPPANFKANNSDNLNISSSWTAFLPTAGNIVEWNNIVTAANTTSLGANLSFSGIKISDPGGPVTINAGNTLTLGSAAIDLDLSAATQDLTVNSDLAMSATNVWDVAASRTLTFGGVISGSQPVTKQGLGTAILTTANTYTGTTSVNAGTLVINGSSTGSGAGTTNRLVIGSGAGTNGAVTVGSGAGSMSFGGDGYTNAVQVGVTGGTGALTINGGTVNLAGTTGTAAASLNIGVQVPVAGSSPGTGSVTVNNGTLNVGQRIIMGANNIASSGTLTISGGAVNVGYNGTLGYTGQNPGVVFFGSGTGTLNLDGGALSLLGFKSHGSGTAGINFNGGTLVALGSPAHFLGNNGSGDSAPSGTGMYSTVVKNGGAKIDTNGFNISIPTALVFDPLSPGGGLTKSGSGTLTLSGASTYTGATLVSDGSLVVNGSLASSAISIASGATLGGGGSLGGTVTVDAGSAQITAGNGMSGTLTTQNLTFSGAGIINVGELGSYSSNPAIDTLGALTLNGGAGAVTLNLSTSPVASGTYRLVRASSGIADASGFALGTAPTVVGRQAAGTLQYDSGTKTVTYTTGGTYLKWSGAQSTEWSTNLISPAKNWQLANGGGGADFIAADEVLFDDSATGKIVDISNGDVFPSIVSFANSVGNDYALQGINGISGTAVLLKTGSGKLSVSGTNSYTGGTTISSGILAFANGALGTSGPITVNGGTLEWDASNSQDISSRLTLANSTTATLDTNGNDVTLASAFGGGTSSGLTKSGNGILTLSAANTYTGITNINGGTLKIGNATSLGTQTGATDRTIVASGATLDLGGVGLGVNNEFVTVSGSGVGGNGAITSSSPIVTPFIGVRFLTLAGDTTLGFTNRWDVGNNTTGGTLTGGGFTLNLVGSGSGSVSLNGLGETDLGDININLGSAATAIAYLQGNTTLGQPGKTVTIAGGSALEVFTSGTRTSYDKKFDLDNGTIRITKAGAMSLPGTIKLTGAGTISANATTVAITSSNEISGDGNLTKAGAGILALTGTNVFTGNATVSAGGLVVGANDALGTTAGTTTMAAGTALGFTGGISYSTAETIVGSGAGNGAALGVFAVSQRGFVQSVSGNNTFAGPIQINATGTSRIGSQDGASLTLSGPITMSGATGVTVLFRVGNTDGDFVTLTNSGNSWDTQSHIFSNNAAAGAGVRLGVVNALPTAAPLVGFGGAGIGTTLDLASFSQEVAGLSNTGANSNLRITNSIAASNSVLTLTNAANLNSGANVVIADGAGVVSLVKAGTFSQTLAAANSFSGDIIVNNGTLIGAGATNSPGISVFGSRLNTRTITVNSGGTLQFNSGNILGANHVSTDSPTLVINSGGIVTNGGAATNNALNNVQLNDGTLTSTTGHTGSSAPNLPVYGAWNLNGSVISTGTSTISTTDPTKGWIMLKVVGDKTTDFSVTSGTLTVSAPVVDNPTDNNIGSLNKSGAGAMVLSAANTYTGNTTVSAGTFELADNAQLKFVLGSTSGVANSISGAGSVTLNGDFVIDTSAADGLTSGSWALENVAALTGAYGSSFTVVGFTDAGANKWTKVNGTKTYTFDETTGILTLASPAGYSSWASTNAIGSTPGQDKDGDGVSNAIEYVLGGNVSSNDLSKLPQSSITGSNLVFTFQRNVDSIDGSTLLRIQVGTTLSEWSAVYNVGANTAGSSAGVTVIEDSSLGFDTITLTVPMGSDQKKFARLNVEVTP